MPESAFGGGEGWREIPKRIKNRNQKKKSKKKNLKKKSKKNQKNFWGGKLPPPWEQASPPGPGIPPGPEPPLDQTPPTSPPL